MTASSSGRRTLRLPTDKAKTATRAGRAPTLRSAGDSQTSAMVQSAVAALGAPVEGARSQGNELERLRRQERPSDSATGRGAEPEPAALEPRRRRNDEKADTEKASAEKANAEEANADKANADKANAEKANAAGKPVRR